MVKHLLLQSYTFWYWSDLDGNSRTRTLKFGQEYIRRDIKGIWGLRSQLNFGIGFLDATLNSSPKPDGRYFRLAFTATKTATN